MFCIDAGILDIRRNFHETLEFYAFADILSGRQYFIFCLILLLQIFVYILSIYASEYAPIFLAQLF